MLYKGNKKVPPPGIERGLPSRQNNQRPGGDIGKFFGQKTKLCTVLGFSGFIPQFAKKASGPHIRSFEGLIFGHLGDYLIC